MAYRFAYYRDSDPYDVIGVFDGDEVIVIDYVGDSDHFLDWIKSERIEVFNRDQAEAVLSKYRELRRSGK